MHTSSCLQQYTRVCMSVNFISFCLAGDPSNYLTYFKRATVYLALGHSKKALPDLSKVVELKPDFHQVRIVKSCFVFYGCIYCVIGKTTKSQYQPETRTYGRSTEGLLLIVCEFLS